MVNRYGSFFYGSLLGVFMLAILTRRATATGALWGLIAGMAVVLTVAFSPWTRDIAFLWHNVIGAVVVVIVGMAVSSIGSRTDEAGLKPRTTPACEPFARRPSRVTAR